MSIIDKINAIEGDDLQRLNDAIVDLAMNRAVEFGDKVFDGENLVDASHFLGGETPPAQYEEPRFLTAAVVRLPPGMLPHKDPLILNGALMSKGPLVLVDELTPEIEASFKKLRYFWSHFLFLLSEKELPTVFALPYSREFDCIRFLPDRYDLEEIERRLSSGN